MNTSLTSICSSVRTGTCIGGCSCATFPSVLCSLLSNVKDPDVNKVEILLINAWLHGYLTLSKLYLSLYHKGKFLK